MALALTIILFLTVALGVFSFGAAAYAPSSVLGARLRALGWQKSQPREKPAFRERLEHALDPFSKALPLSPSEVSRTRKWLIQAGYREPRHLTMYVGSRMLLALVGMLGVVAVEQGFDLLLMNGVGGFGFFVPRFVLKRMIKDRQRRITIALPDATLAVFDHALQHETGDKEAKATDAVHQEKIEALLDCDHAQHPH